MPPLAARLAPLALALLSTVPSPARAQDAAAPDTGRVAVERGSLYYEVAGRGRSPESAAVVLIHGGFGDRRMWDAQFRALARSHRVVRYDHRGFGRSPTPDTSYSPVADLVRLLDHLGIRRAHLVGNSLGGSLAIDAALKEPSRVERLVIVASGPHGFPATEADWKPFLKERDAVAAVFAAAESLGTAAFAERWLAHPMVAVTSRDPRTAPLLRAMVTENAGISRMRHWPNEPMRPEALARLGEVRAPTLVVLGDRDTRLVQAVARATLAIPGSRLVVVRGADHLPQMTHASELNRLLGEFLGAR